MSDERRDDGFDLFDITAPDEERDLQPDGGASRGDVDAGDDPAAGEAATGAPRDPYADPAYSEPDPAPAEPPRSDRFARFMQAMAEDDAATGDAEPATGDAESAPAVAGSDFGTSPETTSAEDDWFGSGAEPDSELASPAVPYEGAPQSADHVIDETPASGGNRYDQFRSALETGGTGSDDESAKSVESDADWFGAVSPAEVGSEEVAAGRRDDESADQLEPGGSGGSSRFQQFRSAFESGGAGGDADDTASAGDQPVPIGGEGSEVGGQDTVQGGEGAEHSDEGTGRAGRFSEFMGAMKRGRRDEEELEPHDDAAEDAADASSDWDLFTDEHYVRTTTQDYSDLAAEVARSADEPAVPSAVSADIPGLESGVVGLEDVAGEHAGAQLDVRTAADVGLRVLTGVGLLVLFALSLIAPLAIGVLATVVFFLAAGELSAVLIRHGYRPVVPLTLAGTLGCLVGAWVWGIIAVPVALILVLIVGGLAFGVAAPERITTVDAALTLLVTAWVGGLGAFVFPLLDADDFRWLIAGLVIAIVAMDVGQFFVGRRLGSRPMAPVISPKKTVEGLIGGIMATIVFSVGFAFFAPYDYQTGALLAVAAIVLGPFGDLAVSLVKRVLGIKDMGTVLPGHGGILDRIDALLFMIPAAWVIFHNAGFLT